MPKIYRVKTIIGVDFELEVVEKSKNSIILKDLETGDIYKVAIKKASDGKYVIEVNGVEHVVYSATGTGVFINLTPPMISEIVSEFVHREKKVVKGPERVVQVEVGVLQAPISGRIVEVRVRPGQVINVGDTVLLMESMKMIIEVKSHISGIIEEIYVQPGVAVNKGDKLLKIKSS